MGAAGDTVIIIPAYNEAMWIGNTIDSIRKTGIKAEIIVVSDRSMDGTASIARSKGVKVITLKKHLGKTGAIFTGLKEALKRKPSAVLFLDADIEKIRRKTLIEMVRNAMNGTRQDRSVMTIAGYRQRNNREIQTEYSGNRSFSLPAAWKLHSTKFKGTPTGYGLEEFLNGSDIFTEKKITKGNPFVQRPFDEASHLPWIPSADIVETKQKMQKKKIVSKKVLRFPDRFPKIRGFSSRKRR